MRGGPLSDADVVGALQSFIVSSWAQKDRKEPPPEVDRLLQRSRHRSGSNVACFVLGSDGKLLNSFNGFPGGTGNPGRTSMKEIARYFVSEIAKAKAQGPRRENPLLLPDVRNGVRIFVRLPDPRMFESYRCPVVQTVADEGEWKTLGKSDGSREIDAAKLARWLRLCYPPGMNEQLKPYDKVEGTLVLKPAAGGTAILAGAVRLSADRGSFRGTFRAVLAYSGEAPEVTGVLEGTYVRVGSMGRQEFTLVAAIESRR